MCSTLGSRTCPLGQPWDWRASTSQMASSDTMNSAPHLCGPQIRPGLTSLQPSILLLAPTLGLAFPGCVWTVCFKHWDRNPPGGSWGDVRGAVEEVREIQLFCFLPLALGNAEPPPQPRCLFPCRLALSLARFRSISFPTCTQTCPIKQRVWKPSFLCVAVLKVTTIKLHDYNNHFQALGRLRPVEHFLFRAGKNSTNLLLSRFLCFPSHPSGKH